MATEIHIAMRVDPNKGPLALQLARSLAHYAALLVEEALGGAVISDQRRLEFGSTRMTVDVEKKDYEEKD